MSHSPGRKLKPCGTGVGRVAALGDGVSGLSVGQHARIALSARTGSQPNRDAGLDGPVVMLNLLKFRERANYPADSPHAPCSGAQAYRRYQTAFVETVGDVSRAAYRDALVHRYAGLERTILLQMQG